MNTMATYSPEAMKRFRLEAVGNTALSIGKGMTDVMSASDQTMTGFLNYIDSEELAPTKVILDQAAGKKVYEAVRNRFPEAKVWGQLNSAPSFFWSYLGELLFNL